MDFLKVVDHLNRHPVTFTADMTLEAAVDRLSASGQIGGPVIDSKHQVIGFLSEQDCLSRMLVASYHDQMSAYVSDIMHKDVITVSPDTGIIELAELMLQQKPKLYPVVDEARHLVGVISRSAVLRAIDQELHSHYRKVR
jgi:CBS domain-containing protein